MQFHSVWKKTAAVAAAAAVILGSTVTASAAATGTATATVLVREKASTSSTALATIREGGEVTVLSVDGDWALVEDGSRTGYIAVRYLDIEGTPSGSSSSSGSSPSALRKGDESDAVEDLQEKLIDLGYLDTEATGYFGSATEEAVKAFQRDAGLSADGVAGSATRSALEAGKTASSTSSSSSAVQRGDESSRVSELQRMLIDLGYLETEATGYFGSATESAVKAFQEDEGLTADGVAGEKTFSALEEKSGSGASNASSSSGVLQQGDEGEDVQEMQERLIELGYLDTDATGFFGTATAAAVRAFQKDQGLTADGIVGAETLTMLNKSSSGVSSIPEEEEEDEPAQEVEETQINGDIVLEDWWSGRIDSLIGRGDTYTVTDVLTGKSFTCARYGGDNHLDSEPLTTQDAATMYEIFGGEWTWSARAILLTYDGVTYAAAMNGMPHGGERITTNNFDGQFCIHFLNSRTHGGNQVNEDMQARIMEAFYSR